MVHFIYGTAHSGKTELLLGHVAEDARAGRRSYLIVPEQETVALERRVVSMLDGSAQLNVDVVNFSRLCNLIFRAVGGISYSTATSPVKALVMWNTIRELSPMLEEYRVGEVYDFSLTERMLSAVTELKAYGVSCAELERICERLPTESSLRPKLRDVSLIYSAYCACLSESFSDSQDDLTRAKALIPKFSYLHDANVYIDSFSSFTGQELEFISALSKYCAELYITLPLSSPNDPAMHLESVRSTLARLKRSLGGGFDEVCLESVSGKRAAPLEYLSSKIWNFEASPLADTADCVSVYACETPYSESDTVACAIRRAMSEGIRCSEIAVILRNAEEYRGVLDVSLEKYGIPYFMSEKTDLLTKPLAKFIFSALRIKESGWRSSEVIAHLKSGFCHVDPFDADIFEDYVLTWGIGGNGFFEPVWLMNPDGYSAKLTKRGERIIAVANSVKNALVPPLSLYFSRLDASENVKEMCAATLDFLKDSKITDKVRQSCEENLASGNKRAADEDMKLYSLTLNVLYDLAQILGEKKFTSQEFCAALSLMFSESEIGTIPTSADEVLVGSAPMLRAGNIKFAIIMGLNEGRFPASVGDSGIFTDADKELLGKFDIDLSASTEVKTSEELFYIFRALSVPRERLMLTYSALSSDGAAQRQSIAVERAYELLPNLRRVRERDILPIERIWNAESARTVLSRLGDTEDAAALGVLDAEFEPDIPLQRRECSISPDVVRELFGDRISMTQSRLEKYVLCGFDYYCSYVLKLRESKRAVFRLNDIGSFIHYILEGFMREVSADGKLSLSMSNEEINKVLDRTVSSYLLELLGEDYAVSNRTRHLFLRLKRLSFTVAESLLDEFRASEFHPAYFELGIGMERSGIRALEFTLNDGTRVSLSGVADRVDTYKKGGNIYIRVVDYKTGSKDFSLDDVKEGLNTQLLIYLFSLCRAQTPEKRAELGCDVGGSVLPAGIQYLSTNAPVISLDTPYGEDVLEDMLQKEFSRSGLLTSDARILRAINRDLDPKYVSKVKAADDGTVSGKSLIDDEGFEMLYNMLTETVIRVAQSLRDGKADASPLIRKNTSPCNYCKMRSICRAPIITK